MSRKTLPILSVIILLACPILPAHADFLVDSNRGVNFNSSPVAAPGTPFSLDYTSSLSSYAPQPYNLAQLQMIFEAGVAFSAVDFTLGNDPTIYHIAQNAPAPNELTFYFYDPAILSPDPSGNPSGILPGGWKTEASDGVLTGHYYLEGTSATTAFTFLSTDASFLIPTPEPSALCLLALPGLAFLTRRRSAPPER